MSDPQMSGSDTGCLSTSVPDAAPYSLRTAVSPWVVLSYVRCADWVLLIAFTLFPPAVALPVPHPSLILFGTKNNLGL